MTGSIERPPDEAALARLVGEAFVTRSSIEIRAGGSKRSMGPPVTADIPVDVTGLSGITLHEPAELVIGARAGTPLKDLVAALDEKGQMLPFEPADYRPLLGTEGTEPTVGGLVAGNVSGPRRITAGACRDSLIGVRFVNGRGEAIKSGGRVMKNVTGYDLSKLMAGAWGTLGIVTEAIFKVLPKPETSLSLAWGGLSDEDAIELMSAGLGSPYEVSAAAHRPGDAGRPAITILRLENFASSTAYRADELSREMKRFGAAERLDRPACEASWAEIRDVRPFAGREGAIWRISVAPSKAIATVSIILGATEAEHFYDWGGALLWMLSPETPRAAQAMRAAARQAGGHATLVRAGSDYRASHAAPMPADDALARLSARVKAAFDPAGILNAGRMGV
jgi:glycolate oxidase FAD binding subunit